MKKLVRIILGVVVLILAIAACGVAYLFMAFPKVPPVSDVRIVATPEKLARGEYLTKHVSLCLDCHSERDFEKQAGPLKPGTWGNAGGSIIRGPGLFQSELALLKRVSVSGRHNCELRLAAFHAL